MPGLAHSSCMHHLSNGSNPFPLFSYCSPLSSSISPLLECCLPVIGTVLWIRWHERAWWQIRQPATLARTVWMLNTKPWQPLVLCALSTDFYALPQKRKTERWCFFFFSTEICSDQGCSFSLTDSHGCCSYWTNIFHWSSDTLSWDYCIFACFFLLPGMLANYWQQQAMESHFRTTIY